MRFRCGSIRKNKLVIKAKKIISEYNSEFNKVKGITLYKELKIQK